MWHLEQYTHHEITNKLQLTAQPQPDVVTIVLCVIGTHEIHVFRQFKPLLFTVVAMLLISSSTYLMAGNF